MRFATDSAAMGKDGQSRFARPERAEFHLVGFLLGPLLLASLT